MEKDEKCNHENTEVATRFPETGETFYKCLDCGALIDENWEIVRYPEDGIPF